jgi:S1-C subfamily serine protease
MRDAYASILMTVQLWLLSVGVSSASIAFAPSAATNNAERPSNDAVVVSGQVEAAASRKSDETARKATGDAIEKIKTALVSIYQVPAKRNEDLKGSVLGLLVDAKGTVVTNHSLIKGWDKFEVVLSDGRRRTAKVLRSDPGLDLAIIKIDDDKPLPHAEIGDSDMVEVGSYALSLSNPWSVAVDEPLTISRVLISGKALAKMKEPLLSLDSAIGPGCYPGLLFDREGKFLGLVVKRDRKSPAASVAVPGNRVMARLAEWAKHDGGKP